MTTTDADTDTDSIADWVLDHIHIIAAGLIIAAAMVVTAVLLWGRTPADNERAATTPGRDFVAPTPPTTSVANVMDDAFHGIPAWTRTEVCETVNGGDPGTGFNNLAEHVSLRAVDATAAQEWLITECDGFAREQDRLDALADAAAEARLADKRAECAATGGNYFKADEGGEASGCLYPILRDG